MKKIKVMVVDDSALMRRIISDMINADAEIEVIDTARNGKDLFDKVVLHLPHVITLDVEMPVMDGMTTLRELKRRNLNIPVIMLSSVSQRGTLLTMECLESGAFDFVPKPSGSISIDINKVKGELVEKIKGAYYKNQTRELHPEVKAEAVIDRAKIKQKQPGKVDAVVIGASTGGPKALYSVITELPKNLGVPIFVVQHMPVGFTKAFAERLNANSAIGVTEAVEGETIEKDKVYIAPGGYHMEVGLDKKIHLNTEPAIWGVRPAVDKLFFSACKVYGANLLSVVLTGMGKDGAQGTVEVKKKGGITISEDKMTCTIYGMPKTAYETGMVDLVLPLYEIAGQIIGIVKRDRR